MEAEDLYGCTWAYGITHKVKMTKFMINWGCTELNSHATGRANGCMGVSCHTFREVWATSTLALRQAIFFELPVE